MYFGCGVIAFIHGYGIHKGEINTFLCKCTAVDMVACGREREKEGMRHDTESCFE